MSSSLGIDVGGVKKGYDLVLLDDSRRVLENARHVALESLCDLITSWRPDILTIDSPPSWATNCERATETDLRKRGLQFFQTPWLENRKSHPFFAWMIRGHLAFSAAADCDFALYDNCGTPAGHALEVFPYAIAVTLSGSKRPPDQSMRVWRRQVLKNAGVSDEELRGPDQIDAALASLAGLMALEGEFCCFGNPAEGMIVLPCKEAPTRFHDWEA